MMTADTKVMAILAMMLLVNARSVYAHGAWQDGGVPICAAQDNQINHKTISDGSGGIIAVWEDHRADLGDIYIQRFNREGIPQWTGEGVVVCDELSRQSMPDIILNSEDDIIVIWRDDRSNNGGNGLYAQKFNLSGVAQWNPNGNRVMGLPVYSITRNFFVFRTDVFGGVVAVSFGWDSNPTAPNYLYSQRFGADGTISPLHYNEYLRSNKAYNQVSGIALDFGGVLSWTQTQSDGSQYLYGQLFNHQCLWDGSESLLCDTDGEKRNIFITAFPNDLIFCWEENNGTRNYSYDVYAQRITDFISPVTRWTTNGIAICNTADMETNPAITAASNDIRDGVFVTWKDSRGIRIQKCDEFGNPQWNPEGVFVANSRMIIYNWVTLASDRNNGVFATWLENGLQLYAQRISGAGQTLWADTGILIAQQSDIQNCNLLTNTEHDACITWESKRGPFYDYNIFGQKIIRPVPAITEINSAVVTQSVIDNLAISGYSFQDEKGLITLVKLIKSGESDIVGTDLTILDTKHLTCDVDLSDAVLGDWNVVAYDSLGQTATSVGVWLTIATPTPTLTPSPTPSNTSTVTITPTATFTLTVTPTATISPTIANSPTITATPTTISSGIMVLPNEQVLAYPNPAKGIVRFVWQDKKIDTVRVEVYNIFGERVANLQENETSHAISWDTATIAPGIYLYQVILTKQGEEKRLKVKKLAINK